MDEEAKVRLGLDITPFQQNLRQANREMAGAGESMHKTFLHAGSAAKGFKNLLHEVAAESPILGTALRLAISPVVGAFAAASLAATYFKDQIDKLNERSDVLEKGMNDPITKTKDNLREARKALAEFRYEQAKWLRDLTANDNTIDKQLAGRLGLLASQSGQLKKLTGNDPTVERERLQIQLGLQQGAAKAMNIQQQDLSGRAAMQSVDVDLMDKKQRSKVLTQQNEEEVKTQQRLQLMLSGAHGGLVSTSTLGLIIGAERALRMKTSSVEDRRDAFRQGLIDQIRSSKDKVEKNNQAIDDELMARKAVTDTYNNTKSKLKELHGNQLQVAKDIISTQRDLSFLPGAPGNGIGQPMDPGALARQAELNRIDSIRRNDISYKIAHMNDPKNALGGEPVTAVQLWAAMRQELADLNSKANTGIFVIGKDQ